MYRSSWSVESAPAEYDARRCAARDQCAPIRMAQPAGFQLDRLTQRLASMQPLGILLLIIASAPGQTHLDVRLDEPGGHRNAPAPAPGCQRSLDAGNRSV
jgi:hypothetical protein